MSLQHVSWKRTDNSRFFFCAGPSLKPPKTAAALSWKQTHNSPSFGHLAPRSLQRLVVFVAAPFMESDRQQFHTVSTARINTPWKILLVWWSSRALPIGRQRDSSGRGDDSRFLDASQPETFKKQLFSLQHLSWKQTDNSRLFDCLAA